MTRGCSQKLKVRLKEQSRESGVSSPIFTSSAKTALRGHISQQQGVQTFGINLVESELKEPPWSNNVNLYMLV